jgi:rhamnulokinase
MTRHSGFLAFDIGAESGRAMLGELASGSLTLHETYRFPNEPVRANGSLQWDVVRLLFDMRRGLERVNGHPLNSLGVDTWGCDFALLDENRNLLERPTHYRDARHDGAMDAVCRRVGNEQLYLQTGCQLLPFNTLFQLYAACQKTPRLVDSAASMVMVPDLFNYWLTGRLQSEYTISSTSQMVDPRTRQWARPLLSELGLPEHLCQPLVEPGATIAELSADISAKHAGTPVVAACSHDTASAFASVSPDGGAFLSSGTWSLLGAEIDRPVLSSAARELNFTNEGGVDGTTRLLKNIAGMWLLQACARVWTPAGKPVSYDALLAAAADDSLAFQSLFDPDHATFFNPPDMPAAIGAYCRETGQPAPASPAACTRAILESLALKYRFVLESLERLTGVEYTHLRIVGGGSRNRMLNQFAANAIGRPVVAGPVEATALGNIVVQMVSTGAAASLTDARAVIERSFPTQRFEPTDTEKWERQYRRFQGYFAETVA